ncbi:3'-5' exonuclease [Aristolochia californica]|uniref:3'-5' exonuclease n=1 Tax=Aristolochia californica TaxID=171875 RepID=UPI0035E36A70
MEADQEFPEWDPIDEAELEAIEASYSLSKSESQSEFSSSKRLKASPETDLTPRDGRRRLPNWATRSLQSSEAGESSSYAVVNRRQYSGRECSDVPITASSRSSGHYWNLVPPPSCRGNPKARFPAIKFGGRIVYSKTSAEVEKATEEILGIIETKREEFDRISLGFDMEWKPVFTRGAAQRKTAVIQICMGTDVCHVMHIHHSGIPPVLQSLLEDNRSIKVGVCIGGDAAKLLRDYNVSTKDLEDLGHLANVKLGGIPRTWSLAALLETITSMQLDKPNRVRLGNWEADKLSSDQLMYAATDAYVSWRLYEVLRRFPDANNTKAGETEKGDLPL